MESPDFSDSDTDSNSSVEGSTPPSLIPKTTDLGKKVVFFSGNSKEKYGILRFLGDTEFSEGMWCGVELDGPTGKNNGSIHGIRYFVCEANCGVFVPLTKVKLDVSRRSRSRPNSQPSSRAASVERKEAPPSRPSTAKASTGATPSANKLGVLNVQQELVNRLSQPLRRTSHPASAPGRRQPMKAFATKGIGRDEGTKEKKVLPPFRPGGMYKAASTENIRGMKDKDKMKPGNQKLSQGMPTKKASSERDLRNAGKGSSNSTSSGSGMLVGVKTVGVKTSVSSDSAGKGKRKQTRTSSCSDILDSSPAPTSSSAKSSTTSSSSHTSLENYPWPRTSTPGNRDELTPDGCSSPEESASDSADKGFLEAPQQLRSRSQTPPIVIQDEGSENSESLASHVKRFAESQVQNSIPILNQSVQSPDSGHTQKYFKNGPSRAATLTHPLTSSAYTGVPAKLLQKLTTSDTVSCPL